MNERADIAIRIERSRSSLLRLVSCWLTAAIAFSAMQTFCPTRARRLPNRLAAFAEALIAKAEEATVFLLIAWIRQNRFVPQPGPFSENAARKVIAANRIITLRHLTIGGVIRRLEALRATLHNLPIIARRLTRTIAARAHIAALRHDASPGHHAPSASASPSAILAGEAAAPP